MNIKRVFMMVLDSFGTGYTPDAKDFGDEGADTLKSVYNNPYFKADTLTKLGLFNLDGLNGYDKCESPIASYAKLREKSLGKDTTIGHWEIAGLISEKPFPTYPDGFGKDILDEFCKKTGRGVLCNKPYSGTAAIDEFADEHIKTGDLIVYTSADSVFQIAAHEDVVPIETLYEYCRIAREILVGENSVARVIARPFIGDKGNWQRTANRHDFSLTPPKDTLLDVLKSNGYDVISVGKISDIFAASGVTEAVATKSNKDGMDKTSAYLDRDFTGLCFVNLVDFDMLYGHRRDTDGYAKAISEFDSWLSDFITKLNSNDVLIITSDHGCDPDFRGTDHTREHSFVICYSKSLRSVNLGIRESFADIGKTVCDMFKLKNSLDGTSFLKEMTKNE